MGKSAFRLHSPHIITLSKSWMGTCDSEVQTLKLHCADHLIIHFSDDGITKNTTKFQTFERDVRGRERRRCSRKVMAKYSHSQPDVRSVQQPVISHLIFSFGTLFSSLTNFVITLSFKCTVHLFYLYPYIYSIHFILSNFLLRRLWRSLGLILKYHS